MVTVECWLLHTPGVVHSGYCTGYVHEINIDQCL